MGTEHTDTHTDPHSYTQTHIYDTHSYIYTLIQHSYTHVHIHTYTHIHSYTYTLIYTYTHIHTHICACRAPACILLEGPNDPVFATSSLCDLWKSPCLSVPQFPYLCLKDMEDLSSYVFASLDGDNHVRAGDFMLGSVWCSGHREETRSPRGK